MESASEPRSAAADPAFVALPADVSLGYAPARGAPLAVRLGAGRVGRALRHCAAGRRQRLLPAPHSRAHPRKHRGRHARHAGRRGGDRDSGLRARRRALRRAGLPRGSTVRRRGWNRSLARLHPPRREEPHSGMGQGAGARQLSPDSGGGRSQTGQARGRRRPARETRRGIRPRSRRGAHRPGGRQGAAAHHPRRRAVPLDAMAPPNEVEHGRPSPWRCAAAAPASRSTAWPARMEEEERW